MTNQKHPKPSVILAAALLLSASLSFAAAPAAAPAKAKGDDCGALTTPDKKEYSDTMKALKKDMDVVKKGQAVVAAVEKRYQASCGQLAKYYPQFNTSGAPIVASLKKDYAKLADTLSNVNSNAKSICEYQKGEGEASKAFMANLTAGANAQNSSTLNAAAAAKYSVTDNQNKQRMGKDVLKALKAGDGAELAKEPKTSGDLKGQAIILLGDSVNLSRFIKGGTDYIFKQMNTAGTKRGNALTSEDQTVLRFKSDKEIHMASQYVDACAALGKNIKAVNESGQAVAKDLALARDNHTGLMKEWANNEHIMSNLALKDGTYEGKMKSLYNEKMEKLRNRQPASNITGAIPPAP